MACTALHGCAILLSRPCNPCHPKLAMNACNAQGTLHSLLYLLQRLDTACLSVIDALMLRMLSIVRLAEKGACKAHTMARQKPKLGGEVQGFCDNSCTLLHSSGVVLPRDACIGLMHKFTSSHAGTSVPCSPPLHPCRASYRPFFSIVMSMGEPCSLLQP